MLSSKNLFWKSAGLGFNFQIHSSFYVPSSIVGSVLHLLICMQWNESLVVPPPPPDISWQSNVNGPLFWKNLDLEFWIDYGFWMIQRLKFGSFIWWNKWSSFKWMCFYILDQSVLKKETTGHLLLKGHGSSNQAHPHVTGIRGRRGS